jgi:hypothetical protein
MARSRTSTSRCGSAAAAGRGAAVALAGIARSRAGTVFGPHAQLAAAGQHRMLGHHDCRDAASPSEPPSRTTCTVLPISVNGTE